MWYVILILAAAILLLLTLRIHLKLEISGDRRLLFAGLGRTGPEFDFVGKRGAIRLFGFSISTFDLGKKKAREPAPTVRTEKPAKKGAPKAKRLRPLRSIIAIVPQCSRALWRYFTGLLKAAMVEEAEADIQAGFDSPDLTGYLFGYYQAAMATVPLVGSRVRYTPDWTGASFSGVARLSLAMPLYRLAWLTFWLVLSLPVMKIIKLAIGRKKGVTDV
jgi:hypothetical protein